MDLKEVENIAKKMLANFLNEIGIDGDYYVEHCNCPMAWGEPKVEACGEYITPGSKRLEGVLAKLECDDAKREMAEKAGLILVSKKYKDNIELLDKEKMFDLIVTVIHEMLHSMRNLLIFDSARNDGRQTKNEYSYTFDKGGFKQNTFDKENMYADASQDILKGSIDTSENSIKEYAGLDFETIEDMELENTKKDTQMEKQKAVDEALVELMAVMSYRLYNKKDSIWDVLRKISEKDGDIARMSDIIIKHKDFELFNWMIDPITYSAGDMHYDFFASYTKDDGDLITDFYEAAGIDCGLEIDEEDLSNVAHSETALEEMFGGLLDLRGLGKSKDERE